MFNAVGQVRDSTYMKLGIGSPAQFDYWRTSEVVNIETPEGGPLNLHAKPKPKPQAKPRVRRSTRSTTKPRRYRSRDDLRAMLCSIQQIVDSADNLAACPRRSPTGLCYERR